MIVYCMILLVWPVSFNLKVFAHRHNVHSEQAESAPQSPKFATLETPQNCFKTMDFIIKTLQIMYTMEILSYMTFQTEM